jgi:DNA-binding transcriptional ArsR family regulator
MNAATWTCSRRLPDDQVDLVVEVFRMLADATRVQVLWALVTREMSVNDLATLHHATPTADPTPIRSKGRRT